MSRLFRCFALCLSVLLVVPVEAEAASFRKELKNALKRGPKDNSTTFVLHISGETIEITAADFDTWEAHLFEIGGSETFPNPWDFFPSHIEMYKGSGDTKHNIMINLIDAAYYRMDIDKEEGGWRYEFHIYY